MFPSLYSGPCAPPGVLCCVGSKYLMVCIHTENQDQASFCPSASQEVSVLPGLAFGHLRYHLTGVWPQSNSLPGTI